MSTSEYNDLFLKCQSTTAPYHVYTFDIKDSKQMDSITREIARQKLLKFITLFYNKLYRKGLEENKHILILKPNYAFLGGYSDGFGMKTEPFILGDLVGLTVYKESITNSEMMQIYDECIKEVEIDFEFHIADGYYKTDDWCEAREKYFRGYCIDLLSNLHKPYNDNIRKKLELLKTK